MQSAEGDTKLLLKSLHPVRLLNSPFSRAVEEAEANGASKEQLEQLLGRARAKKGMFEGNLEEGELEIGQNAAYIRQVRPVKDIFRTLLNEMKEAGRQLGQRL